MKELIELLIKNKKKIATMESCTGGQFASEITNINDSGEVLEFSAITYSDDYKIKMGVKKNTIDKYTVYSHQVAKEMSKLISEFANSNYGIGITGKIEEFCYFSIYDKDSDKYYTGTIDLDLKSRKENKKLIVNIISNFLFGIINE